jgi:hypothetical protein
MPRIRSNGLSGRSASLAFRSANSFGWITAARRAAPPNQVDCRCPDGPRQTAWMRCNDDRHTYPTIAPPEGRRTPTSALVAAPNSRSQYDCYA